MQAFLPLIVSLFSELTTTLLNEDPSSSDTVKYRFSSSYQLCKLKYGSGYLGDNRLGAEGDGGCRYRQTHLLSVAVVLQGEGWKTLDRNLSLVHASGEDSEDRPGVAPP